MRIWCNKKHDFVPKTFCMPTTFAAVVPTNLKLPNCFGLKQIPTYPMLLLPEVYHC